MSVQEQVAPSMQHEKLPVTHFVHRAIDTLSPKGHKGLHLRKGSNHVLSRVFKAYYGEDMPDTLVDTMSAGGQIEAARTAYGVTIYKPGSKPISGTTATLAKMGLGPACG